MFGTVSVISITVLRGRTCAFTVYILLIIYGSDVPMPPCEMPIEDSLCYCYLFFPKEADNCHRRNGMFKLKYIQTLIFMSRLIYI